MAGLTPNRPDRPEPDRIEVHGWAAAAAVLSFAFVSGMAIGAFLAGLVLVFRWLT